MFFLKNQLNFVGNLSNFDKILIINFVLACSYSNGQHDLGEERANNMTERGHGEQRDTNKRVSNMTGMGGRDNNATINVTGRGKGDACKAELQDRRVACARINTWLAGDTTRRERKRMSKGQEGCV